MPENRGIALITGAGANIGRAGAVRLATDGFTVVLSGRRREPLEESAAIIQKKGGTAVVVPCDVTDEASVDHLFDEIMLRFGRLDVLYNNAGGFWGGRPSFEELTLAGWRQTIDTNLTGSFLCARGAFRIMKTQDPMGGRIINTGSVSAYAPREYCAPYTASRHGVTGLTRQIALDGRRYDIACGQIDVGNAKENPVTTGPEPQMHVDQVADAISLMAGLPLEANVLFMTVMATKMPFVGRG